MFSGFQLDRARPIDAEVALSVVYDGGKLVKGHKRHLLVETLGLLLQVVVSAANGARESWSEAAIGKDKGSTSTTKDFRGWGYDGKDFITAIKEDYQLDWEVVKRKQKKGFKVLPWRWIVERTLALVNTLQTINY